MAKYGREDDSKKQTQFYFRGAGISRSEQKQINQMLGRGILGILAFAVLASVFAKPSEQIGIYPSVEQIEANIVQSEQAAYQNQIDQTVNDCSSALKALSQHEQTGSIGISSDEYVNRQIELIRLKDTYCR